jgi:hypothetical protein
LILAAITGSDTLLYNVCTIFHKVARGRIEETHGPVFSAGLGLQVLCDRERCRATHRVSERWSEYHVGSGPNCFKVGVNLTFPRNGGLSPTDTDADARTGVSGGGLEEGKISWECGDPNLFKPGALHASFN